MLDLISLDKKLPKKAYRARLPRLRMRLLQLQQAAWQARMASVLVFEGWNAAGKGDCIRKLTERLEPRGYRLFFVNHELRTSEKRLPWMWRFWLEIPNYGQMTIFQRSWYRRLLIERGEGRLGDLEWHRGVRDVLDFERTLTDDGYVLIKLFLHVGKDELEARYRVMESDPAMSWRVGKRQWRHHRRYDHYLELVEEVLARTETAAGPWKIVEATDRRWARVTVFETVIDKLEAAMRARGLTLPEPIDAGDDDSDEDP